MGNYERVVIIARIPKEKIEEANNVSILDYVNSQGYVLQKKGNTYCLKDNDSLIITPSKNIFYWNSRQKKGGPIQFVMEYEGVSWKDAVHKLIGENFETRKSTLYTNFEPTASKPKIIKLPKEDDSMKQTYGYLLKKRFLEKEIVDYYVREGTIKQSFDKKNVMFIGKDYEDEIKYISQRGTIGGNTFKGEVAGSNKEYGFKYMGNNEVLRVFESPIDLLSFQSVMKLKNKEWQNDSCISLGGVSDKALLKFIEKNENITNVKLSLDLDKAGDKACDEILIKLHKLYPKRFKVDLAYHIYGKDFNEYLVVLKTFEEYKKIGINEEVLKKIGGLSLNVKEIFSKENLTHITDSDEIYIYENVEDFLSINSLAEQYKKNWYSKNFLVTDDKKYIEEILKGNSKIKNVTFCFSKNNKDIDKINFFKNKYCEEYNVYIHNSKDESYLKTLNNNKKNKINKLL